MPALAVFLLAACASPDALPTQSAGAIATQACSPSAADQAWLDRAVDAWSFTARNITQLELPPTFEARIFDSRCLLASATAMAGGPRRWSATPHNGQIPLPDGQTIPAQVTSFATGDGQSGFFVMSTPSVWRAGGVDGGALGLETLMVAVLLHEGSHVAQIPTYGRRMEALSKRYNLPDSFNDDSIQERFEDNREFADSVERETRLLLAAASARDEAEALRLAREARAAMRLRHDRWYTGEDSYLREAEDIWLTMEGSGQWAGYRWLADPRGGRVGAEAAAAAFGMRGKYWSQKQGFALVLVLDRLTRGRWKRHAFRDGAKTAMQMLDEAMAG